MRQKRRIIHILAPAGAALSLAACAGSVPAGDPPTPAVTSPPPTQVPQAEAVSEDPALADALDALPERIVLTLHDANGDDLALWNRVTGEFTALAPSPFNESHATWSPDGEWLAFQTDRDGDWEIDVVRPTCEEPSLGCNDDLHNLTNNPDANDMYPNWSPDGRVVHMSTRGGNPDIWLSPLDEGEPAQLTDHPGPDWHPNLSPEGGALALRSDRGANPEIWGIDLESGQAQNLTDTPGTDRYPGYSPDGSQILFVSNRDGDEEIYVMDARGENQTNLTENPAEDRQGSWSPDGRYILFISDRAGEGDLYLMDAQGGDALLLLDASLPLDWPFWSPVE
jgi:Tol biopolymer transport system component